MQALHDLALGQPFDPATWCDLFEAFLLEKLGLILPEELAMTVATMKCLLDWDGSSNPLVQMLRKMSLP